MRAGILYKMDHHFCAHRFFVFLTGHFLLLVGKEKKQKIKQNFKREVFG
jgi:uncharacterized membrane protein